MPLLRKEGNALAAQAGDENVDDACVVGEYLEREGAYDRSPKKQEALTIYRAVLLFLYAGREQLADKSRQALSMKCWMIKL